MTYAECIYKLCDRTNLDDKDDVISTMQFLARECLKFNKAILLYEQYVKARMTAKDYEQMTKDIARELFAYETSLSDDEGYKEFVEEHFEEIVDGIA